LCVFVCWHLIRLPLPPLLFFFPFPSFFLSILLVPLSLFVLTTSYMHARARTCNRTQHQRDGGHVALSCGSARRLRPNLRDRCSAGQGNDNYYYGSASFFFKSTIRMFWPKVACCCLQLHLLLLLFFPSRHASSRRMVLLLEVGTAVRACAEMHLCVCACVLRFTRRVFFFVRAQFRYLLIFTLSLSLPYM